MYSSMEQPKILVTILIPVKYIRSILNLKKSLGRCKNIDLCTIGRSLKKIKRERIEIN